MCITHSQAADTTTHSYVSLSRQLTDTHIMNSNRITELKEKIAQLESLCQEPCKDRAEIQETTGRGVQNMLFLWWRVNSATSAAAWHHSNDLL